MADLIDFNNIVGNSTIADGGYAGRLIKLIGAHVDESIAKNRITQAEAGAIYVSTLAAMIKEAVQFELNKEVKENEIELGNAKILISLEELAIAQAELLIKEAELDLAEVKTEQEQYTLDHMLPAQVNKEVAQTDLYRRQIQGFDEHERQQAYDKVMETWGITYSSLPTPDGLPDMMNTDNVNMVMRSIYTDQLGIDESCLFNVNNTPKPGCTP